MESIVSRVTKIKLRTKATKLVKAKLINNVTPSRISGHLFSAFTTFGIADSFILSASVSPMLCHTCVRIINIPHERKMMKFSFIHSFIVGVAHSPSFIIYMNEEYINVIKIPIFLMIHFAKYLHCCNIN